MSYRSQEYVCEAGHRTESLERRSRVRRSIPCEVCGETAVRCISAPKTRTVWASAATQGRPEPPPSPLATNTEAIGEGQSVREWRKQRAKVWREHDRKKRIDKGLRP